MGIAVNMGGASAPWVAKGLSCVDKHLPLYVMGALGLATGILCCFLPETKGTSMKENRLDGSENKQCTTIKNNNFAI